MTPREAFAYEQRKKYPKLLMPVVDPDAVMVWDYVTLSQTATVGPGCIIGYAGVGYIKEGVKWLHIPQVGRVIIEDNVNIYPGTHIQRGTIDNTIIGEGTVIGHNCNIAHNVKIGKNCMLTNNVVISGSVTIGDGVYIAPGVTIKDHAVIARNVHIGQGSNVVRHLLKPNSWYVGNPAKYLRKVKDGDV